MTSLLKFMILTKLNFAINFFIINLIRNIFVMHQPF